MFPMNITSHIIMWVLGLVVIESVIGAHKGRLIRNGEVLGKVTQDINAMGHVHIEHVKTPHIILENLRLG